MDTHARTEHENCTTVALSKRKETAAETLSIYSREKALKQRYKTPSPPSPPSIIPPKLLKRTQSFCPFHPSARPLMRFNAAHMTQCLNRLTKTHYLHGDAAFVCLPNEWDRSKSSANATGWAVLKHMLCQSKPSTLTSLESVCSIQRGTSREHWERCHLRHPSNLWLNDGHFKQIGVHKLVKCKAKIH